MTPDERTLLQHFLGDLGESRGAAKDPEADAMIAQAMGANPDAAYLLVQHALIADQALQVAQQRLEDLQHQQGQPAPTSFLGGGVPAQTYPPAYSPQTYPSQSYPQQGYPPQGYPVQGAGSPGPLSPNGGLGGFLRTAGTMAAGVAGGDFLAQGLSNLFSPRGW